MPKRKKFQQYAGKRQRVSRDEEQRRLGDAAWLLWGPYLSERQWGTLREDKSSDGNCWEYLPHHEAIYRAYEWGEDGLFGISDNQACLCLALALWNGRDPFMKERLFGLTGPQGNHGEDVKECYSYVDSTPSHSYMRAIYKYPQSAFPYDELLEVNRKRGLEEPEYEILDTGVFEGNRYFDVMAEYAKASPEDILCQFTVHNRSDSPEQIHLLPNLWFRKTLCDDAREKPLIRAINEGQGHRNNQIRTAVCNHPNHGSYEFVMEVTDDFEEVFFTENETNVKKVSAGTKDAGTKEAGTKDAGTKDAGTKDDGTKGTGSKVRGTKGKGSKGVGSKGAGNKVAKLSTEFYKDAFHEAVVKGNKGAVNPSPMGTKCAGHYKFTVPPGGKAVVRCRLYASAQKPTHAFGKGFNNVFNDRKQEMDDFYHKVVPQSFGEDERQVAKQAYAGLCWTKQYYQYNGSRWWNEKRAVNKEWRHMDNHDVISMPDKWEFPWYATWDLAFHMVPFADIDVEFAQNQLLLLLSERYMHPNGQLPAYEFNFSDVNPPVHAWACARVYCKSNDLAFLKRCFHKLLVNFSWWVNTKSPLSNHLYAGGFLGMDNISCIERSNPPVGCVMQQADGTAWMAFYSLCMLDMALKLALLDNTYEDLAIQFLQHFILIAEAAQGLWCPDDLFFYDQVIDGDGTRHVLRIHSMVGLSLLFGSRVLSVSAHTKLSDFSAKLQESSQRHSGVVAVDEKKPDSVLLSVVNQRQLESMLKLMVDENEMLSLHGVRALSKVHKDKPVSVVINGETHSVEYCPGESNSDMFGGNSNWRGPVWICMNFLLLESLDTQHKFYEDSVQVEMPKSSGCWMNLKQTAQEIRRRIVGLFIPDKNGHRPCDGGRAIFAEDPHWKEMLQFYEYFHGDTGRGCGASHQTGWTALITNIMKDYHQEDA